MEKRITLPITKENIKELKAGDSVLITGKIITGRDAAHKRLYELLKENILCRTGTGKTWICSRTGGAYLKLPHG